MSMIARPMAPATGMASAVAPSSRSSSSGFAGVLSATIAASRQILRQRRANVSQPMIATVMADPFLVLVGAAKRAPFVFQFAQAGGLVGEKL
jgi:hypothetical protein